LLLFQVLFQSLVRPCVSPFAGSSPSTITTTTTHHTGAQQLEANLQPNNPAATAELLKRELTRRGLKCGGTVTERAQRLFTWKDSPLEQIPKKWHATAK
jgi:hypothetical protein